MPTFSALTTTVGSKTAEAVAATLEELSPLAVAVIEFDEAHEIWEVGAHFSKPPDDIALALIAAAFGCDRFVVSKVPDRDWVAHVQRNLKPVSAGRFHVSIGDNNAERSAESVAIRIQSSMAFGTGHHGTTQGCLYSLEKLLSDRCRISSCADIGCGTAILSLAAALANNVRCVASDCDPVALDSARVNIAANAVSGLIECVHAEGLDHLDSCEQGHFDIIFVNIVSEVVISLLPGLARFLEPAGHAVLSGFLVEQSKAVLSACDRNGMEICDRRDIGGWTTLTVKATKH